MAKKKANGKSAKAKGPRPKAGAGEAPAPWVVEWWPLEKIKPYHNNARHNEEAVEPAMRSLREFGANQPIVVDRDGVIVAGHTRREAAERLGWAEYPVYVAGHLTPAQARAYRIADNATNQWAKWDYDRLRVEIDGLRGENQVDVAALGLRPAELDALAQEARECAQEMADGDEGPNEGDGGEGDAGEEEAEAVEEKRVPSLAIIIPCENEGQQREIYNKLTEMGVPCRVSML